MLSTLRGKTGPVLPHLWVRVRPPTAAAASLMAKPSLFGNCKIRLPDRQPVTPPVSVSHQSIKLLQCARRRAREMGWILGFGNQARWHSSDETDLLLAVKRKPSFFLSAAVDRNVRRTRYTCGSMTPFRKQFRFEKVSLNVNASRRRRAVFRSVPRKRLAAFLRRFTILSRTFSFAAQVRRT